MNRTKIAAIVFILSAGIIASYAILKNSALKIDLTKSGLTEENAESSISQNPIKWLGKAVAKINDFIGGESNESAQISLPKDIDFENINLTEFVAKSSFTQMKNLDQSGQDPFEIDPNDPANKEFIEKAVAGIGDPSSFFNPIVDDKDLKISQDNSKEAKIQYLRGIEQISKNRLNNPKYFRDIEQMAKDIQVDCMTGGLSIHKELAQLQWDLLNDYLNLTVPQDWLSFHRDFVNIHKKTNLIYSALANCFQDPIKGNLAIQIFPQMVEESKEIQSTFYAKRLEMGL